MKKKKIILFMLVMITLITPNFVSALTEEEVYAKLENLPFKEVDGKKYFETKIVNPDIIIGDDCLFTTDDYNDRYDKEDGMSSEEWISEQTNMCKSYLYQDMVKLYLKYLGYDATELFFNFDGEDFNKATMYHYYDTENGSQTIREDVEIYYLTDVNMKEVEKAKKILSNFKEEDRLYGLQLVNLMYHYGKIEEADYKKDTIFARYSSFKKIMEQYPEYQYVSNGGRGGGDPITRHRVIQAGMFKDGVMYGIKQLDHYEERILFVSKDSSGNLKEKVETRLNEYFNNKVEIEVEIENGYTADDELGSEWVDNYVNNFLGTEGIDATGYYSTITINDKELFFVVVEVPKEYVEDLYVEAHDSKTGVNVKTDSYDVPIDVRVKANDVKDNKKIKDRFDKENLVVKSAYDMSLTKSFDGTFVNKIDRGIEVYFPVDEKYKVGDKHKVYYVSETSEDKEIYDGEVVKVDGKNYVKFITNHFSTYVLASEAIENPQTFDGISNSILISVISFIGLCGTIYFLSRNNKSKINI